MSLIKRSIIPALTRLLPLIVGLALAAPGCGGEETCGPASCKGCCDVSGTCVEGSATAACGYAGQGCTACQSGESCKAGQCIAACDPLGCPSGCCQGSECKPGTASDACGKGGLSCLICDGGKSCVSQQCVAGACDASTCADGCCQAGQCLPGNTKAACGKGAVACAPCVGTDDCVDKSCQAGACGPGSCAGCCEAGACQAGNTEAACGAGGQACTACPSGSSCTAGQCDVSPTSEWKVTVVSAEVLLATAGGKVWDPGALPGFLEPDVFVELISGTQKGNSGTKDNTNTPLFNDLVITAKASELKQSVIVKVWDEDPIPPDQLIGTCNVTFNGTDLLAGTFTVTDCGGIDAKTVNFSFAPK